MTARPGMPAERSPLAALAEVPRLQLWLLGALGALKALGLVLVADSLAQGIVGVIDHRSVLDAVTCGLLGAGVRGLAAWGLGTAAERTASGVKQRLRARLTDAFLYRGTPRVGSSAALGTGGLDELDAYYTTFLPALVNAATVPLLVGARILFADWLSAAVIVATLPLIPLFMALIGMHTRDRVAAATDALGRLSDHLVELARGLPVLVGLGRFTEQSRAMAAISEEYRVASMRTLRTAFLSALALELLSTISVAVVAVFIGIRLLGGGMSLEAGLVALILVPECFAPFREVGAAFHASDAGLEALRRTRALLDAPRAAGVFTRRVARGARARRLTVRYAGRTTPAVHALTFTASAGEITLLDGASGCGKSTVLALLAGRGPALDDTATCTGTIAVEAADRIAWLPQHPHATAQTARDELIVYGARDAGVEAAEDADALLARMRLDPDADPAEFSPGELRRLAFARVLARVTAGATLVLLDEPTAHLDRDAAALVLGELAAMRRRVSVIVASHDPAVHAFVDRIVAIGRTTSGACPTPARTGRSASVQASTQEVHEPLPASREPSPVRPEAYSAGALLPAPLRTRVGADTANGARIALRELATVLRPVAGRFAGALIVGTLATAFAIALTVVSGWLIVRASQEPAIMYLLVAIVGVRFFGIGRAVLRYAERLLTHDAVFRSLTALRVRLWAGLAHRGPAGRASLGAANAVGTLIADADRVRDLTPRVIAAPAVALLSTCGIAVALGLIYPPAGLVVGFLGILALVAAPIASVAVATVAARADESARSRFARSLTGMLAAADDLAGNGVGDVVRSRLSRIDAEAAATARRGARTEAAVAGCIVAAGAAAAVLMLPLTSVAVASGTLDPALVAVLALSPLGLIEPLLEANAAARRWPSLAHVLRGIAPVTADADRADASVRIRSVPGRVQSASGRIEAASPPTAPRGASLRLDDVSYRYPGAAEDAFTGVDALVEPGRRLVVTGPSGSGKSTVLALLLRYLRPTAGRYLIDGTDAAGIPQPDVLRRLAWCPQEGHLFNSTLRANLTIARAREDAPSDEELVSSLRLVGLGEFLDALPAGLDTMVGASGGRLSGGQRQRVAVARTLLRGGDVVLIDEPTAHLDEQASRELMRDLRSALAGRTTVLVTHHPEEVDAADRVLRLGRPTGVTVPAVVGGRP
ncbi:MAG TPA: thiol reductant ABC exporter subunit CydC [Humibacter sp.]|nr:thiol reductant ABC exporter subunit CydC [Humibacter sp.]